MSKTAAERREIVEKVLNNQRLEGLCPSPLGMSLIESYVKGQITSETLVKKLNAHYKRQQDDQSKVA